MRKKTRIALTSLGVLLEAGASTLVVTGANAALADNDFWLGASAMGVIMCGLFGAGLMAAGLLSE